MPSSYTSSLRLVLPVTGELISLWGDTVNNGLTKLVEDAIAGTASVAMGDANVTLTTATEAADQARCMFITLTGALTAQRNVVCPSQSKLYFVTNNTTGGQSVNFKTSAGTGVLVAPGTRVALYCDGTNVLVADTTNNVLDQGVELDIASAATVDVGNALTPFLRVTGTTGITSFGTAHKGPRYLRFADALVLTHNAATLLLPTGANIATAAGDRALLVPVGNPASGWMVAFYQRANGASLLVDVSTATGVLPLANGGTSATTAAAARAALGVDPIPVGMMMPFAVTTAPTGWLALPTVPTNISRITYAALFAAIGTAWGAGDGSTTFGMPYLPEGYAPLGTAASVSAATVGQVISHSHGNGGDGINVTAGGQGVKYWGDGPQQTGSTGGAANLAAGIKFRWCVKI